MPHASTVMARQTEIAAAYQSPGKAATTQRQLKAFASKIHRAIAGSVFQPIKPKVVADKVASGAQAVSEVKVREVKVREVKVPEDKVPEDKVPEDKVPEVKVQEVKVQEAKVQEDKEALADRVVSTGKDRMEIRAVATGATVVLGAKGQEMAVVSAVDKELIKAGREWVEAVGSVPRMVERETPEAREEARVATFGVSVVEVVNKVVNNNR